MVRIRLPERWHVVLWRDQGRDWYCVLARPGERCTGTLRLRAGLA